MPTVPHRFSRNARSRPQPMTERIRLLISGTVQGVGFRPFLHRLANRGGLTGLVRNAADGVLVEVQGPEAALASFLEAVRVEAPEAAHITGIETIPLPLRQDETGFRIAESGRGGPILAGVPPDLATCDACLAEVRDPRARRYRYPFANCTCCGPRFTIVTAMPYDRPMTTMQSFPLCPDCAGEYGDPADRRFHAQPIACPSCGPRLRLRAWADGALREVPSPDPLAAAIAALRQGGVVAVKGLGGFHLAADAACDESILAVRRIKSREAKPLAVMCRDIEQAAALCCIGGPEGEALRSAARPIVVLQRRPGSTATISAHVAPGSGTLGIMLPYTPLHHLLLEGVGRPLVMTSANPGDEPIAVSAAALSGEVCAGCAFILDHDRRIAARNDDSVLKASPTPVMMRRSRGYVPAPIPVPPAAGEALGLGGDQKNTACFIRDGMAFLTPHVGSIEGERSRTALNEAVRHLWKLYGFTPQVAACDEHPGYLTRDMAHSLGLPVVQVQHHHAHIAACLAENEWTGRAIGVSWDGTGYGRDGTVWGGEFLLADLTGFTRAASLRPVFLPGGERAVREPWRMAAAYLYDAFGRTWPDFPGADALESRGAELLVPLMAGGVNSPATTSAGRLFDAAAALLGLGWVSSYEGQAAMALESLAARCEAGAEPYPYAVEEAGRLLRLDFRPLIREMLRDLQRGEGPERMARSFHRTLAAAIAEICRRVREAEGLTVAALSGGVFQNVLLLTETVRALEEAGFTVLRHREVPPNDGGLSLGQAAVAAATLA